MPKLTKPLPALLLVLIAACCWQLATLGWRLVPQPPDRLAEPAAVGQPAPGRPPSQNYRDIAAAHLFGTAAKPTEARADIRHAPPTQLKLQLRGVVLTDEPAAARAIIAAPGHPESPYPLGSEVPGGATLEEFYPDRVILKRNGRHETLRINIHDLPAGEVELGPPDPIGSVIDLRGDRALARTLGDYRAQLMTDPVSLTGLLRVAPAAQGDAMLGYRIREDSDLEELGRFGLRAGDVITAVNGVTLNDPSAGLTLLRRLTVSDHLEFNVMREEDLLSFYFQIDN